MRAMVLWAVLFANVAAASEEAWSWESEAPRTFVGLVPIPFGQGIVAVDGEKMLSPRLSVRLGVRLDAELLETSANDGGPALTFLAGVEPGFRGYLTGTALDGLWVGPHLELSCMWVKGPFENSTRNCTAGVAALVGYSVIVARGLTVQAGAGLGASYSARKQAVPDLSGELTGFTLRTHDWSVSDRVTLAVGWTF